MFQKSVPKEDFKEHPYVNSIEFSDNELKVKLVPDYPDLRSGTITITVGEHSWSERTENFFEVPIGQIDHADKQTCIDCFAEIAPIIRKHYGTFNVLDQQFLLWSQMYQTETEKEKKEND